MFSGILAMVHILNSTTPTTAPAPANLLDPAEVIEQMIDLRIQLRQIEQQIEALQPLFFAACISLNTEKIERERAIITKRFTPGQWTYSEELLEQDALLKKLRRQFQLDHEPTGGREVTWMIKLMLAHWT
jgi:hypothetical protein